MTVGLFGGTFDPIHRGHISMAQAFADELQLQQVIFIPAGEPYHKNMPTQTPAQQRLHMVELAMTADARFAVSDVDMVRTGATYTVDTLHIFRQYFPQQPLWWLIGMDSLQNMHTWHRYQDILKLTNIAVAARNRQTIQQLAPPIQALVAQGLNHAKSSSAGQLRLLQWQPEDISSTQIRAAVKQHQDIGAWVTPPVADYIARQGLYR